MPTLTAELELLVDQALQNVQQIDDELTRIASNFSEALAAGLAVVGTELQSVEVTADVAPAEAEVQSLVQSVEGEQLALPVDADTTEATGAVSDLVGAVDAENAEIHVDADTTDAQSAVDDLSGSVDDLAASGGKAQSSMHATGLGAGELGGLAGLATGEVKGLGEASGIFGEHAGVAAGAGLALGAGIAEIAKQGFAAVSAEERFNATLGDQAVAVKQVDIGSLSTDLFKLGAQFGSTDAQMQNATSSVFQFAVNSGASREEATKFADGIAAISARAVALNPTVGTTSDVMERAAIGIGRARTAASLLNIGLSTMEVNTLAAKIAQDKGEESATAYDKSVAALQISVERFGPSLKQNIADGAENAANKTKAARAEFENAVESFAKPLVSPALDLIKTSLPVAEDLGKALADVASVAIPLLKFALDNLGPAIEPVVVGFLAMKTFTLGETLFNSLLLLAGGWGLLGDEAATAAAEVQAASLEMAESEAVATSGLSLVFGLAAAAAVGLGLFGDSTQDTSEKVKDFATALEDANGQLDETAGKAARSLFEARHQGDDLAAAGLKLTDVLDSTSNAGRRQQDVLKELADVTDKVKNSNGSTTAALDAYGQTLDQLRAKQRDYIDEIRKGNPELAAQLTSLLRQNDANSGVIETLRDLAVAHTEVNNKLKDRNTTESTNTDLTQQNNDAQSKQNTLVSDAETAMQGYKAGTVDATTALKAMTDSQKEENDALNIYKNTLEGVQGLQGDVTAAQVALGNAQQHGFEALEKNGAQFDINTQAGRDNVSALQAQVSAVDALAEATFKQTGNQSDADKIVADFTNTLDTNLTSILGDKDAADAIVKSLGLVPAAVQPATDTLGDLAKAFGGAGGAAALAALENQQGVEKVNTDTNVNLDAASAAAVAFAGQFTSSAGQAGTDGSAKFGEGVGTIPDKAGQAVTDAGPKVTDAASALSGQGGAAFAAGLDVGTSFDQGMADGIATFSFLVSIAAINAVNDAETAARTAAKSKSPSLLFAEIGRDLALGMAQGLDDGADAVAASAASVVGRAAASARVTPARVQGASVEPVGTVATAVGTGGPLIGQQTNNFHVPVPDPSTTGREMAAASRTDMFLNGWV